MAQHVDLWLDDVRPPLIGWEWVKTVEEAKALILTGRVRHASLDHDLGAFNEVEPSGYDLCCWMEETGHWPSGHIIVHSMNPVGAERMKQVLRRRSGAGRG